MFLKYDSLEVFVLGLFFLAKCKVADLELHLPTPSFFQNFIFVHTPFSLSWGGLLVNRGS
jgi:hypothetical protein